MARPTVVRPEEIRRHNVRLMLEQIHRNGALTRAELTTLLGLNRSTIGDLVADLVGRGLVDESVPGGGEKAGRPSHVVTPRAGGPYVLAVEVEVERIVSATVGLGGRVYLRRETVIEGDATSPAAVVAQIASDAHWLADRMPARAGPVGVGVSVPAIVRRTDGMIVHAANLRWRDVPFGSQLREQLAAGLEVRIGNDANLGALAEHQRGAARLVHDVIYLSGSVGVGGGVIIDGTEIYGASGYAGEIGHIPLNPDGPRCHCGSHGCVETYLGEHALLREAGLTTHFGPAAVATVLAAAERGEPVACAAVATVARWLGRTLAILINIFNPQAIVVGDTLGEILRLARPRVEEEIGRRAMTEAVRTAQIMLPELGRDSSLIGASELAFQHVFARIAAGD